MSALRRHYGATPLHLLAHVALFAATAFVVLQVVDIGEPLNVLLWFVGAILLHDLALLPFYSVLDRAGQLATRGPAVNYVRVPLALSALMLVVFFPLICDRSGLARVAGEEPSGYLGRWLLATALLCAGSLAIFAARRVGGRAARG